MSSTKEECTDDVSIRNNTSVDSDALYEKPDIYESQRQSHSHVSHMGLRTCYIIAGPQAEAAAVQDPASIMWDGGVDDPESSTDGMRVTNVRLFWLSNQVNLADAVALANTVQDIMASTTEEYQEHMVAQADSLLDQFNSSGNRSHLEEAYQVASKVSTMYKHIPILLFNLGASYFSSFQHERDIQDLQRAIDNWTQALSLVSEQDEIRIDLLRSLGFAHFNQFRYCGDRSAADMAIKFQTQAVDTDQFNHPSRADMMRELGVTYMARFERYMAMGDITVGIEYIKGALSITSDDDERRPLILSALGGAFVARFNHSGHIEDLDNGLMCQTAVNQLSHTHTEDTAVQLTVLGISYMARFKHLKDLSDIDRAIYFQLQGKSLISEGHRHMAGVLYHLGISYKMRFQYLGSISDIDSAIFYHSSAASLIRCSDPHVVWFLNDLGTSHLGRFEHVGWMADLEYSLDIFRQAFNMMSKGDWGKALVLNNLGRGHTIRFERFGDLSDVNLAIEYLSNACLMVDDEDIRKSSFLVNLAHSFQRRYEQLWSLTDLDSALACSAQAVSLLREGNPERFRCLVSLGSCYSLRFERTRDVADIDHAISLGFRAVTLSSQADIDRRRWLDSLSNFYTLRFIHLGHIQDIDKAILCSNETVNLTPDDHIDKSMRLNNLCGSYIYRFQRLEILLDLDKALECQLQAVSLCPDMHADLPRWLNNLGAVRLLRFRRLGYRIDINLAVDAHTRVIALAPDGHVGKVGWLNNLSRALMARFEFGEEMDDLDRSINLELQALALVPEKHAYRPIIFRSLADSYEQRCRYSENVEDIQKAVSYRQQLIALTPKDDIQQSSRMRELASAFMQQFSITHNTNDLGRSIDCSRIATLSLPGTSADHFRAARQWALFSEFANDVTGALQAWKVVVELLPTYIWLGASVISRYESISSLGGLVSKAASLAIYCEEYELALEWLEEGCTIVWKQISQLRAPMDGLADAHPELAQQLRHVGIELELAGASRLGEDPISTLQKESPEQIAQKQRRLAEDWDRLLQTARSLPGFENFLRPKAFSQLASAARSGPVIVLNTCKGYCSALILLPGGAKVSHVRLSGIDEVHLANLQHQMSKTRADANETRKPVYDTRSTRDRIKMILSELWVKLVKPIFEHLQLAPCPTEDLPHVTWCATGSLGFLPLHAAGDYDDDGPSSKAYNYAFSSYAPNLSVLLARAPSPESFRGALLVGQTATPGQRSLPKAGEELDRVTSKIGSWRHTRLDDERATCSTVLEQLEDHSWVHLACHGSQNTDNAAQSAFYLHDGALNLGAITQKSIPHAGLAFLSACQTATGDERLPNEAVHLAAGMLLAGYPSVIATMWSIRDDVAPLVAEKVYEYLTRDGVPDSSGAAKALHLAVEHLREEVGECDFESWVPYIHIGV